jgi:CO/xanthine dehydrogenase Mo-binding subunit
LLEGSLIKETDSDLCLTGAAGAPEPLENKTISWQTLESAGSRQNDFVGQATRNALSALAQLDRVDEV